MDLRMTGVLTLVGALAGLVGPAAAQPTKKVLIGADIQCPANFDLVDGKCKADAQKVKSLGEGACNTPGLAYIASTKTCEVIENQAPVPKCAATEPPSAFDKALKQCVVQDDRPRSGLGDYVGDCFRVRAVPASAPAKPASGGIYAVVAQRAEGSTDKLLTLAETDDGGQWKCASKVGTTLIDLKASDLIAMGADRSGWAYGVLALPYKFHFDDKSFGSGVSIGPYFGRRWGTPGSAYTLAMAATIGSVKGEVRDSAGNVTSTPDLQAFSLALGYMYDIAKGSDTRPFKIGFFVGADVVGADNVVKYKHNKKPWLALQIGFDFTDN
jgi:hypothetical protein